MIKVIIFGTGDNSQIANFFLSEDKNYEVVAFTIDSNYLKEEEFEGKPVIGFEKLSDFFSPDVYKLFIPVGYTDINQFREKKFLEGKSKGYEFITYISPRASVASNAKIGENCFILEDNTIQPYVNIEDNCVLWSGNHIGHHSTIEKNCFISSHVVISGGCKVGRNSFLGVNATIRDHVLVGSHNIIGMGANVTHDTNDYDVYIKGASKLSVKSSKEIKL